MKEVLQALSSLLDRAKSSVTAKLAAGTGSSATRIEKEQLAGHAVAYLATELAGCEQLAAWAGRVGGQYEQALAAAYIGDVARTLAAGVDLGPCENISWSDLGVTEKDIADTVASPAVVAFAKQHATGANWLELARLAKDKGSGDFGLDDSTLVDIKGQFGKFADVEVIPRAQDIHRKDILIPDELVAQMGELGVFGLTIPEEYDGLGLGKVAMCVVTEELSRGYIGVGSLGTRSEIAAELILGGGSDAQKKEWLPKIASARVLPTAVFTEPNNGSDLAHIKSRAERQPDGSYRIYGQKTWITHAVRADLMTLLARTNPKDPDYSGLSMFLAAKTRKGAAGEPEFVDAGLTGTEIKVLGYRGMKEYELGFDGFAVNKDALLGNEEGAGFKQLMRTFESARIQTAARGVGVSQAALDDALRYAHERIQFGKPIAEFPRVGRKIGRIAARTQAARQLTYYAARRKDSGDRCDLEAGMAKLLATRAAWEAADANVQIHGGNGYAEEYLASRLLVDARVLSIFEGANEIQAHVIARRLLEPAK